MVDLEFQTFLTGVDGVFGVRSRLDTKTSCVHGETLCRHDGGVTCTLRHGSIIPVALKVHVQTYSASQQLCPVLVEAHEHILDRGTSLYRPGGKQAGGTEG